LLQLYLGQKAEVPDDGVFLPYVANGVLQVADLSAMPETLEQRRVIDAGKVLGPHIVAAAMVDGKPPIWPEGMTSVATTPEQGRQLVRDAKAQGYDLMKVYSKLELPVFQALVAEAKALHVPVVGHIPARDKGITSEFFIPGFGMVAHAEEFAQQTALPDHGAIPRYIELLRANGTGVIATLTVDDRILQIMRQPESLRSRPELGYLHPVLRNVVVEHNPYAARAKDAGYIEKIVAFNRDFVRQAHRAGIPVLAGTDAPVPGVAPGFALHDELQSLVAAGLSNYEALAAATTAPARWLGQQGQRGSIERGAHADMVLLDADPLADIGNTRRIAAVIVRGAVYPRAELDKRMEALRKR
ncbi:MAG TPA: amidohydrolase family protein, partial [Telluria sp.]|nr:amidohydrolase family protein [Telluria sp.]